MSASRKEGSAIRNVSAILAATRKTVDCKFIKLSNLPISGILELSKEFQHGFLRGVVRAKNQDAGKIIVNATGQVQSVEKNVNV